MYQSFIKPALFQVGPEMAHHFTTAVFSFLNKIPGVSAILKSNWAVKDKRLEREVFGLKFPNPVGLAAGFDKNAELYKDFKNLGFGFIEIGTVTPKAQPGNPKPRMFRLPDDEGLINRMGFNNGGMEATVENLKSRPEGLIIGGNIGKNKVTPNEQAIDDYEKCFEALYDHVDYFVVNVSSPNTPGLRDLQEKESLQPILQMLKDKAAAKPQTKPVLLKIAPDLTDSQLDQIVELVTETKTDGIIATNTTISRDGLKSNQNLLNSAGGLSGQPVKERATEVIRYLHQKSNGAIPIIGVGGIASAADAIEKLEAGAALVQVYTGLIYEGPSLIKRINKGILAHYGKG